MEFATLCTADWPPTASYCAAKQLGLLHQRPQMLERISDTKRSWLVASLNFFSAGSFFANPSGT